MGKSSKKSTPKVDAAPAVASTLSAKKGKREAEEALEMQVSARKQKRNEGVEQAVKKQKVEAKAPTKKKEETSSSDDSSSEEEVNVKGVAKNGKVVAKSPLDSSNDDSSSDDEPAPPKKQAVAAKIGTVEAPAKKSQPSSSSDDSESSEDGSEEDKPSKEVVPAKKATQPKKAEKDSSSDDSESKKVSSNDESEPYSSSEEENKSTTTLPKKKVESSDSSSGCESEDEEPVVKTVAAKRPLQQKKVDSDSADESSEESDEEPQTKKPKVTSKGQVAKNESTDEETSDDSDESSEDEPKKTSKKPAKASEKKDESKKTSKKASEKKVESDEESSEEESEDEPVVKTPKRVSDVEMVDASPATNEKQQSETKAPQTPITPQGGGLKTLFVGNLPFAVQKDDVAKFFKGAEVVDVRLATDQDGNFRGFGHVEFASAEDAQKAFKQNGQDLMNRPVKLDFAREKGAYTPGGESNPRQQQSKGRTVFVRGFGPLGEDGIRSAVTEHFEPCGSISRIGIPKDYESGQAKGFAYVEFTDDNAFNKALELNGVEVGDNYLMVEEARPRNDSGRDSGNRGGRSSGFRGGRNRGGRSSFNGRSGRDGGGGRFGTSGGGGRRGGRGFNKPNLAAAGTGRKTTFGDD